ncbi:enoyl-CoA hydratase/isomerase family protein [Rhodococcus sp. B50]|uniref:enoyl-CoA hydratase/isomerase family protein n=1 Tax=Rhodococcus sp. B50 TaxID=2682847 RepID=UPI001A0F9AB3|nr:enoyl-CoA hydratase-related protein [Rhodococcus sp. B50]MBS9376285.1 putative enoyl-CoA hydratase echA12 [Rhodococcus sp. B50]
MTPEIRRTDADGVTLVQFNRPELGNAFTDSQVSNLESVLGDVAADESIRVLVLTGTGRHFNVGGMPSSKNDTPAEWERSPDAHRRQMEGAVRVVRQLHRMPKITIAAVNGGCAGAGLALALATDLRFAATHARFNTAFLAHGIPGELGAIWFATRLLGPARAREVFLMPGKIDAETAERLGLVNGVFDPADFLPSVVAMAQGIAASRPESLRAMKANLNDALTASLDDYLDRETERMITTAWTVTAPSRRRLGSGTPAAEQTPAETPSN